MDYLRECFDRQIAATDELLRNFLTGPAPKEEEMEFTKTQCAGCGTTLLNLESCQRCTARTTERHARFERAYMAALTGQCYGRPNEQSIVEAARAIALETVHQWDAMISQLDGEEG